MFFDRQERLEVAFCTSCGGDKRTFNVCPHCGAGPHGVGSSDSAQSVNQWTAPQPAPAHSPYPQQQIVNSYLSQNYQTQRTNGFAVASFVCSLLCISILAIIFGHVALSQIRRTREGGQGLATAGLIIGYLGFAILVLAFIGGLSNSGGY